MHGTRVPLIFLSLCLGCGGASTAPSESVQPRSTSQARTDSIEVSGLHATFHTGEVDRVFNAHMDKLNACYEEGLEDLEDIEGTVAFAIAVGDENRVTEVFVQHSDLGSLEVEQCMVRKISHFTFRRQGEGLATAEKALELEAPYDHPSPIRWNESIIGAIIEQHQADVDTCLGGASGVQLTLWVGRGGMVLESGMSTDTSGQVDAGTCLAKSARRWAFPDPGKDLAKVQVSF